MLSDWRLIFALGVETKMLDFTLTAFNNLSDLGGSSSMGNATMLELYALKFRWVQVSYV